MCCNGGHSFLVNVSAFIGIIGGYFASVMGGFINSEEYVRGLRAFFVVANLRMMVVKKPLFSLFILTSVACYQGYFVKGGSIELGKTSTKAVVVSNIPDSCI